MICYLFDLFKIILIKCLNYINQVSNHLIYMNYIPILMELEIL